MRIKIEIETDNEERCLRIIQALQLEKKEEKHEGKSLKEFLNEEGLIRGKHHGSYQPYTKEELLMIADTYRNTVGLPRKKRKAELRKLAKMWGRSLYALRLQASLRGYTRFKRKD